MDSMLGSSSFTNWSTTVVVGTTTQIAEEAERAERAKLIRKTSPLMGPGARIRQRNRLRRAMGSANADGKRSTSSASKGAGDGSMPPLNQPKPFNQWDLQLPRSPKSKPPHLRSDEERKEIREERLRRMEEVQQKIERRKRKKEALEAERHALTRSFKPMGPPPKPVNLSQFSATVAALSAPSPNRQRLPPERFNMYS